MYNITISNTSTIKLSFCNITNDKIVRTFTLIII
nr:MAG TPA: hypothetical protein [Caudoviricetes sp.]